MNPKIFTKNNYFLMLALDHRDSFVKMAGTNNENDLVKIKYDIINSLIYQFSGVLIDMQYGFKAYSLMEEQLLKPFLMPVEKSGYQTVGEGRANVIGNTIDDLKEKGASGAKLLIYFNKKDNTAKSQIALARTIYEECKRQDFPFFLEIVHYTPTFDVLDTLKIFKQEGVHPSVFKLEYPGNSRKCHEISEFQEDTPWILLSRGVDFNQFYEQVFIASRSGCGGFLAGRSLWQEVFRHKDLPAQTKFLSSELPQRFARLRDLFQ